MSERPAREIDLSTPLSFSTSFRFPLQCRRARREILLGALWLLVPGYGWVLNRGHRIVMVHRMQQGRSAWPAWDDTGQLFRHGMVTLGGMVYYYSPAILMGAWAYLAGSTMLAGTGTVLFVLATLAIPGFMSHYCRSFEASEIFNPFVALRRCLEGGRAYWHAWAIALSALVLSFLGLLALGVGFLVTSVWFWQVAGFSFARVFTRRFALDRSASTYPLQARRRP